MFDSRLSSMITCGDLELTEFLLNVPCSHPGNVIPLVAPRKTKAWFTLATETTESESESESEESSELV